MTVWGVGCLQWLDDNAIFIFCKQPLHELKILATDSRGGNSRTRDELKSGFWNLWLWRTGWTPNIDSAASRFKLTLQLMQRNLFDVSQNVCTTHVHGLDSLIGGEFQELILFSGEVRSSRTILFQIRLTFLGLDCVSNAPRRTKERVPARA